MNTINIPERDNHTEPLGCGHFACGARDHSIWYQAGSYETGLAGTRCFDCASLAEHYGYTVTMIPTNEQILTWLDWEREDIGIN